MKYLLDTCVFLWAISGESHKIAEFIDILQDERTYVAISVVTYWEIAIKRSLGKLEVDGDIVNTAEKTGFTWINLEVKHIAALEKLPKLHADPFDRLLVAQAKADNYRLLTTDQTVLKYL